MRTCLICFLLFFLPFLVFSQGENNFWYFGKATGINFTEGQFTIVPSVLNDAHWEFSTNPAANDFNCPNPIFNQTYDDNVGGSASISDSDGNLLFYTDGYTVFNKLHQVMTNGSFLNLNGAPSKQHAIIVPHPENSQLFYIFTAASPIILNPQNAIGIGVSLVSFENNTLGEILWKNASLESITQSNQAITATYNSENDSIWVLVPYDNFDSNRQNDKLYTFIIDSNSIIPYNCNNNLCVSFQQYTSNLDIALTSYSEIKVSPDKSKISISVPSTASNPFGSPIIPKSRVYGFNNNTGLLSNNFQYNIDNKHVHSSEFSSDSNLLFAIMRDLSCVSNCQGVFVNSKLVVFDLNNPNIAYRVVSDLNVYGSLQRAIDGNIYFTNGTNILYKIEDQNSFNNSSISSSQINLGSNKCTLFGLPQLIPTIEDNICSDLNLTNEVHFNQHIYFNHNNITTSVNYVLENTLSQDIEMYAQNSITLYPNTHIKKGVKFYARIKECDTISMKNSLVDDFGNHEKENSFYVTLFPNPTSTIVSVESSQLINNVFIFSMEGLPIYQESNIKSEVVLEIDVSNFKPGIYIIKLVNQIGEDLYKRLIVH